MEEVDPLMIEAVREIIRQNGGQGVWDLELDEGAVTKLAEYFTAKGWSQYQVRGSRLDWFPTYEALLFASEGRVH